MRIVYWPRLPIAKKEITDDVNSLGDCEFVLAETLTDVLAALPGADALVLTDAPTAEASQIVDALSAAGNRVRWMHFISAGREGFEAAGLPRHLTITYAAGAVAPTVAEHAMALLLALVRRVPEMVVQNAERRWDRSIARRASSLEGRTLAIVGFGRIGEELGRRARAFGMRVVAVTRTVRPSRDADAVEPLDRLHPVLADADVVVVAIALTADTHHLIDAAALAACRRGALLVNVARGGVVDQAALGEALRSGQIGGAGLDVTDPEPLPAGDPLWSCPNLLISPHFGGGGSRASVQRLAASVLDNLQRLRAGEPLLDVVDVVDVEARR